MKTMLAATITAPGTVVLQEVDVPVPEANEVLVRLEGCGVCASNVPPWEGREWFSYPLEPGQLGHEGWGRVEKVGSSVSRFVPGQRLALLSNHAYAQFDKAPETAVIALPEALDDLPFPGEPLGCAVNIFKRCAIEPGDVVAIVGIGFLGALLTQMAVGVGAKVYAISRREFSLHFAREAGAATTILMDDHWRIIEEVKALTGGRFCDVVIEAVGKQWPLDLAAELCRERGRLVVAGYHQDGLRQINLQLWNWRGLDVINAHEREEAVYLAGMREAAERVANSSLMPAPLYTHHLPLEQLAAALDLTKDRPDGFMKCLLQI